VSEGGEIVRRFGPVSRSASFIEDWKGEQVHAIIYKPEAGGAVPQNRG